jgi:hypothetical protein
LVLPQKPWIPDAWVKKKETKSTERRGPALEGERNVSSGALARFVVVVVTRE